MRGTGEWAPRRQVGRRAGWGRVTQAARADRSAEVSEGGSSSAPPRSGASPLGDVTAAQGQAMAAMVPPCLRAFVRVLPRPHQGEPLVICITTSLYPGEVANNYVPASGPSAHLVGQHGSPVLSGWRDTQHTGNCFVDVFCWEFYNNLFTLTNVFRRIRRVFPFLLLL